MAIHRIAAPGHAEFSIAPRTPGDERWFSADGDRFLAWVMPLAAGGWQFLVYRRNGAGLIEHLFTSEPFAREQDARHALQGRLQSEMIGRALEGRQARP
jgi:hypothetical protein